MKKIQDFGNKIGGARKDLWRERGMLASDIEDMNDDERTKYVTRDYVWPLPDAKKLVADGRDVFIVFWQREVRRKVRKSPVIYSNDQVMDILKNYIELVSKIRDTVMAVTTLKDIEDFYALADKNFGISLKVYRQCVDSYNLNMLKYRRNRMMRKISEQNFPNGKRKSSAKPRKRAFIPPQLSSIEREGENYRHGLHITEKIWQRDFNFYGVEFGNWTSQKDRQFSMDYGYDALRDLAVALQIDTKDISFSGKLSLAFGARGISSASAHYETLRRVINLTKMHGAGCTAHEWMHALDHHLSEFYGITDHKFASESKQTYKLPEVFVKLVSAFKADASGQATDYYLGSKKFDTHYAKDAYGHWASSCEMLARAFACYVKDVLGCKSDYLIAHADVYEFEFDNMKACAIPQGEERDLYNELFDVLFYKLKSDGFLHEPQVVVKDAIEVRKVSEPYPELDYDFEGQYSLF